MNDIEKAIKEARSAQMSRIYGSFNNVEEALKDEDSIHKSEESDIEKSDIMYAISSGEIKVSKSGKEIKEQVENVLIPDIKADMSNVSDKIEDVLKECGKAPTKDVEKWWTCEVKMDVPYKIYDWDQVYYNENPSVSESVSSSQEKDMNFATSQEEAKARRDYNDLVRAYCQMKVDLKACEILKGLNDNSKYDLTPKQVLAFKF